jgi:hypothetical protein
MTNFEKVAAPEYINAIEKYFQGGELSGAELEDALNARHLSYQGKIVLNIPHSAHGNLTSNWLTL